MKPAIRAVTLATVRLALRLQPRSFRDRFSGEILDAVERDLGSAAAAGWWAYLRAAVKAAADPLATLRLIGRPDRPHAGGRLTHDFRMALRHLRVQRGTVVTIVATLGIALAGCMAMIAVADAAFLRPLPFPDGDELVRLTERPERGGREGVSLPAFDIWSREAASLAGAAFYEPRTSTVMVGAEPEHLGGAAVSRDFFSVLGVAPAIGRAFTPAPRFGPPDEAVISQRLYRRLGGSESVLGSMIAIDPHVYRVVGVMPSAFTFPSGADFWVTSKGMGMLETERSLRFLSAIGRLRKGASPRVLQAELDVLTVRYPAVDRVGGPIHMRAVGLRDSLLGDARGPIRLSLLAVALLLVAACCNVSALLLARISARRRELAVHRAMGASSWRLVRQYALESLILSVPACILGLLGATALVRVMAAMGARDVPGMAALEVNGTVAAIAVPIAIGSALIGSLIPAAFAARVPVRASLSVRDSSASPGLLRSLRLLVIAQVTLGFVVALSGALLVRSIERMMNADHGFDADRVAVARINIPLQSIASRTGQVPFYSQVIEKARALPGVIEAGVLSRIPMSAASASSAAHAEGRPDNSTRAVVQSASPGALPAIGARFLSGRDFDHAAPAAPHVIINDQLARALFPGEEAVGKRVTFQFMSGKRTAQVAGVVKAVRHNGLAGDLLPSITLDYRTFQFPMSLVARVSDDAESILPGLRGVIRGSDTSGRVTVDYLSTLDREVARELARPQLFAAVIGTFSLIVLGIAGAGVFGLLAFWVGQRRRELGIRLALGAPSNQLIVAVAWKAVGTVAVGIPLGVAASLAATRSIGSMLFGVERTDALSFAVCALLFIGVAVVAAAIPARRASRVDPLVVLRSE